MLVKHEKSGTRSAPYIYARLRQLPIVCEEFLRHAVATGTPPDPRDFADPAWGNQAPLEHILAGKTVHVHNTVTDVKSRRRYTDLMIAAGGRAPAIGEDIDIVLVGPTRFRDANPEKRNSDVILSKAKSTRVYKWLKRALLQESLHIPANAQPPARRFKKRRYREARHFADLAKRPPGQTTLDHFVTRTRRRTGRRRTKKKEKRTVRIPLDIDTVKHIRDLVGDGDINVDVVIGIERPRGTPRVIDKCYIKDVRVQKRARPRRDGTEGPPRKRRRTAS